MKVRADGWGERSLSSWQRPQQPCHGCSPAYGSGGGSEAAEGGGCDGGGGESCSQQWEDQLDRCDRSEGVGLPISGPAEILVVALHPGGRSRVADFPSQLPSAAVGGEASLHPGQGSCCSCPAHSCSDEDGGCLPVAQLECQLEVESDWMFQSWSWVAE